MDWIREIVEGLIEIYETRNVYELLDVLEITLIKKELPPGKKGRFFRDMYGNESIFIADNLDPVEEKCIIAHELGHAILHVDISTHYYSENELLVKSKLEIQANYFASELLIEDELTKYKDLTIKELSYVLEATEELIIVKGGSIWLLVETMMYI